MLKNVSCHFCECMDACLCVVSDHWTHYFGIETGYNRLKRVKTSPLLLVLPLFSAVEIRERREKIYEFLNNLKTEGAGVTEASDSQIRCCFMAPNLCAEATEFPFTSDLWHVWCKSFKIRQWPSPLGVWPWQLWIGSLTDKTKKPSGNVLNLLVKT